MKKTVITKISALFLCFLLLFMSACAPQVADTPVATDATGTPTEKPTDAPDDSGEGEGDFPENGAQKIVTFSSTIYASPEMYDTIELAHYESTPDIPMISAKLAAETFISGMLAASMPGASAEITETDYTLTVTRENGAFCILDFVEDTVYFSDFDLFFAAPYALNPLDLLSQPFVDADGNPIFFQRENSFHSPGFSISLDLTAFEIPLDIYDGVKYLPLQTFNDLFLAPRSINLAYNGSDVFMIIGGALSEELKVLYYAEPPAPRSEALANFNYRELCFFLDLYYGLQEEHRIYDGFRNFFYKTNLYKDFLDEDPSKSFLAISDLVFGHMADFHSSIIAPSPYIGPEAPEEFNIEDYAAIKNSAETSEDFLAARNEAMPDGIPGYMEVGNTAYVTFDTFTFGYPQDYNDTANIEASTLGLIIEAHKMITREDSPIENVVLDLSCNGGGAFDAAAYVVAWMIGSCDLNVYNELTDSLGTTSYAVDVNLDNKFDENDTISDKNLYCLISPVSFSCGNYVPAMLKASGNVTLIGDTSGGGACVVMFGTTADGSIFQISGRQHLAITANGSYYSIDRGVEPHFHLSRIESFYDRESLTEYINGLK